MGIDVEQCFGCDQPCLVDRFNIQGHDKVASRSNHESTSVSHH